jgi:hypothetical protein
LTGPFPSSPRRQACAGGSSGALAVVAKISDEGATKGRRTGGWITSDSDANRETQRSMVSMTETSTDEDTNEPTEFLEPGIIKRLSLGEDVRFGAPGVARPLRNGTEVAIVAFAALRSILLVSFWNWSPVV